MNRLVDRHVFATAQEFLSVSPGLVIEGARQVGKSTLARQLMAGAEPVTVTLDDPQTRAAAMEDPGGFVAQAGSRTLVIDEIQRFPELTLAVKAAIDADRRPGQFILTGSASLLRVRGLADSLAGRVLRLSLWGFSQGELTGTDDDFAYRITDATQQEVTGYRTATRRTDYAQILAAGSYPEATSRSGKVRRAWFDSYIAGVVRRDIAELRREVNPARAESLLRALAGNQAGELVKARLAQASAIPAGTVTTYLDLLADVGLLTSIPPWTPNLLHREVGRHKAFVTDSGLAVRLSRLTGDELGRFEHAEALGAHLEAFVVAELIRQRTWAGVDYDVFHYRDRAGVEVDVVLELSGGSVIALEIKASQSLGARHFSGLRTLRDGLGDRLIAGIVLYTGQSGYRFSDRLYGLPIDALWRF